MLDLLHVALSAPVRILLSPLLLSPLLPPLPKSRRINGVHLAVESCPGTGPSQRNCQGRRSSEPVSSSGASFLSRSARNGLWQAFISARGEHSWEVSFAGPLWGGRCYSCVPVIARSAPLPSVVSVVTFWEHDGGVQVVAFRVERVRVSRGRSGREPLLLNKTPASCCAIRHQQRHVLRSLGAVVFSKCARSPAVARGSTAPEFSLR